MMKNGKIYAADDAASVLTLDGIQTVYGVVVTINYHQNTQQHILIKTSSIAK